MANPQAGTGVPETIVISNIFSRRIVNSIYSLGATIGPLLDVYWYTFPVILRYSSTYTTMARITKERKKKKRLLDIV